MITTTASQKRRDDKIAVALEIDRSLIYHALSALEQEGVVKGFNDRRRTVLGEGGRVWSLRDGPRTATPPPRQEPLLWSMFGGRP